MSPQSLRQTYAVHTRVAGCHAREVQLCLGHRCLNTTVRYALCSLPEGVFSPLDSARGVTQVRDATGPDPVLEPSGLASASGLAALARDAREFLHTLHCPLGSRLFCSRKASTGPP